MDRQKQKILEAIDCCRPGSDDARSPDMDVLADAIETDPAARAEYEKVQQSDAHIQRVFGQVPVPDGLQDRLLASLAWEEGNIDGVAAGEATESEIGKTAALEADAPSPSVDAVSPEKAPLAGKTGAGLRWWYMAAAGTAAVVLIAVTIATIVQMTGESEMTWDKFARLVEASVSTTIDENAWTADMVASPTDRPFPSDDFAIDPIGWRHVPVGSLDHRAAAYLLSDRGRSEVVLLVIRSRRRVDRVMEVCPGDSLPTSGNQSIGAWRSGDYVFVLVVRGTDHGSRYRSMVPRLQVG